MNPQTARFGALTGPALLVAIAAWSLPQRGAAHSHPGSESFYVLSGQVAVTTAAGVSRADAGQTMNGLADTPMQVTSGGSTDLDQFVLFVVDATKPFSTPAKL